jgi:hypothetical protein
MKYIGIDNGVSGSIAILDDNGKILFYAPTPVKKCLDYPKKKKFLNRLDGKKFENLLIKYIEDDDCVCYIERPMVNPTRWNASISAVRCMEASLIVLELLEVPYQWIDSKEWQKELLPSGAHKEELKGVAVQVAKRLYPKAELKKDADGLLIAYYAYKMHKARR